MFRSLSFDLISTSNMARTRQFLRQRRPRTQKETGITPLEAMAVLLLADADDDDEELAALLFLHLAIEDKDEQRNSKYGRRGPYNCKKSREFFALMLNHYPEKWFKSWFRCAANFHSAMPDNC